MEASTHSFNEPEPIEAFDLLDEFAANPLTENVDLTVADNSDDAANILADEEDENALNMLVEWMISKADVIPSVSRKYGIILLGEGIGSVNRLRKRLQKEGNTFLSKVGFKDDDAEEIILALNR